MGSQNIGVGMIKSSVGVEVICTHRKSEKKSNLLPILTTFLQSLSPLIFMDMYGESWDSILLQLSSIKWCSSCRKFPKPGAPNYSQTCD